jgi:hypothetical protein
MWKQVEVEVYLTVSERGGGRESDEIEKLRRPRNLKLAVLVQLDLPPFYRSRILMKHVSIYSAMFHVLFQLSDLSVPFVLSRFPNFSYQSLD